MTTIAYQPSLASKISHELRVPVTGIMGMVHFLNTTHLNRQQKKYLKTIEESANRLLSLETKLQSLFR